MSRTRDRKPFLVAFLPCILLATSGIWLFMIYLWSSFGTPFAFSDGQTAFHQGTTLGTRLIAALQFEKVDQESQKRIMSLVSIRLVRVCWYPANPKALRKHAATASPCPLVLLGRTRIFPENKTASSERKADVN